MSDDPETHTAPPPHPSPARCATSAGKPCEPSHNANTHLQWFVLAAILLWLALMITNYPD